MYIYLEQNYFIPLKEIIAVVDYEKFISSPEGKSFISVNKNKVIDLSEKKVKSLVITDRFFYLSSYVVRSFQDRGNEYNRLKYKGKRNLKETVEGCNE